MVKVEKGTIGGLAVAATAIALGFSLEGGHLRQVLQPTAAVIVIGGTLGAILVQFPLWMVRQAFRGLFDVFRQAGSEVQPRMDQIFRLAMQARKHGIVSLDAELKKIPDPFFRKVLMLAIDGIRPHEIREIMDLELLRLEEEEERGARVWEAAGGFAPTIGILGAVLGLIQIMQQLDDIGAIGRGIAVAFVATLYGVGLANLFLLPVAGKLRGRVREAHQLREATLEGVLAIAEGASPRVLRERLGAPQMGSPRAVVTPARLAAR